MKVGKWFMIRFIAPSHLLKMSSALYFFFVVSASPEFKSRRRMI